MQGNCGEIIWESDEEYVDEDKVDRNSIEKKLSVLKQAYESERKARENLENQLEDAEKKIELLKLEIDEKEKSCVKLHRENDILQQNLFKERSKLDKYEDNRSSVVSSSLKNLLTERRAVSMMNGPKFTSQGLLAEGQTENWEVSKFKEESRYFKRQYEIIAEKLKICDEQVLEQRARVDQLSFQLRKSENFTKEKESEISVLNKYIQNLATTKMELSKENERLEEESMRREEEGKIMEEEGKRRREEIEDLELEIKGLKEIKETQANLVKNMENQIQKLSEKIEYLNSKCQLFPLIKIGTLGSILPIEIMMMIRKDVNDDYIIEIENKYSKIRLLAQDIIEVKRIKDSINRFTFIFKNSSNKEIESNIFETKENLDEVCGLIIQFLELDRKNRKAISTFKSESKGGFFGEMLAFFTSN